MPAPNTNFDLTVDDLGLIEDALRETKAQLVSKKLDGQGCETTLESNVRAIHELLGRLHNQKVFYRPSKGAYIGG